MGMSRDDRYHSLRPQAQRILNLFQSHNFWRMSDLVNEGIPEASVRRSAQEMRAAGFDIVVEFGVVSLWS